MGWPPSRPSAILTTRGLRAAIALPTSGEGAGLPLDGFFALNGAMPQLQSLFRAGEALIVHAVHTSYRAVRISTGRICSKAASPGVGRIEDGWLNRALPACPTPGVPTRAAFRSARSCRSSCAAGRRSCPGLPKVYGVPLRDSTIARLMDLYAETDPVLARAFAEGMEIDRVADATRARRPAATTAAKQPPSGSMRQFTEAADAAAKFCPRRRAAHRCAQLRSVGTRMPTRAPSKVNSPCVSAPSMPPSPRSRPEWVRSGRTPSSLVVTEFGRTARVNGTDGTDHGMATIATMVGGA